MRSLRLVFAGLSTLALAACFNPQPKDGGFACDPTYNDICPPGYGCKAAAVDGGTGGICVRADEIMGDMRIEAFDLAQDIAVKPSKRTCDQLIAAGAFSNLKALTALNTAADENHIAYDAHSKSLLFLRGGVLYASSLSNGNMSPGVPVAVTITPAPSSLGGGSFDTTSSANYWFSGTTGGTTQLFQGVFSGGNAIAATAHTNPSTTCPFSDPTFETGAPTSPMYFSYALSGCSGPSYVVVGGADKTITSSYSAFSDSGWAYPSLSPAALTIMFSSTGTTPQLYYSQRDDLTYTFGNPVAVNLSGIGGAGTQDLQMAVTADCSVAYFVSVRSGGAGGADIYAAEIASE